MEPITFGGGEGKWELPKQRKYYQEEYSIINEPIISSVCTHDPRTRGGLTTACL